MNEGALNLLFPALAKGKGALRRLQKKLRKLPETFPASSVKAFFSMLFGNIAPLNENDPIKCCHVAYLSQLLGYTDWPMEHFKTILAHCAISVFPALLEDLARVAGVSEDDNPCVQIIKYIFSRFYTIEELLQALSGTQQSETALRRLFAPESVIEPPASTTPRPALNPHLHLLYELAEQEIKWIPGLPEEPLQAPCFAILVSHNDGPAHVIVEDWILASRWSYFQHVLVSDMMEAKTRTLDLMKEFDVDSALLLLHYIYGTAPQPSEENTSAYAVLKAQATYLRLEAPEFDQFWNVKVRPSRTEDLYDEDEYHKM